MSREDAPSRGEIQDLVNAAENFHEELPIIVFSRTGLRKGEFYHLKIHWINWKQGQIEIPSKQRCLCADCKKDGNEWTPKTKNSARNIGFVDSTIERYLSEYFDGGITSIQENYSKTEIWRIVKRCARRVDNKREFEVDEPLENKVYPHSLRASFASMMADNDASPSALQDVMGWKDINTARRYIKASGRAGKRATNRIRDTGKDFLQDY